MTQFDTVIFGGASSALLFDEEGSFLFDPKSSATASPCREGEVRWVEELDNSYVRMPAPLNLAQVEAELRKEESKRNALFFTLASFDTTLPIDLRAESAEIADDLLSDREISEWLEHIISAQPLT